MKRISYILNHFDDSILFYIHIVDVVQATNKRFSKFEKYLLNSSLSKKFPKKT